MTTKHKAGHGLPISNGYCAVRDRGEDGQYKIVSVDVHCGRCKASYQPDRDWVTRYFAAAKKETERQITKGYATRGSLVDLDDERDRILAFIKPRRRRVLEPEQPGPSTNPRQETA
jgi:hypothetical protein